MSRYEFAVQEQADTLPNEDIKILLEKSRVAALASELMAEDADKIEPTRSNDKYNGYNTSDVGYPEYTNGCLINRVAELDPDSRTSIDRINKTPQLLGEAVKSADVTAGTVTKVRHSQNNYIFKNYKRDDLQRLGWEKTQQGKKLSTYEAIALINPNVTDTKAVLIETKRDHGDNAEVVAQAAAQKMIMERSGVRLYTRQQIESGFPARLVKQRILDVIKWGESSTGAPNTTPNVTPEGVITKPGFVSTPKNEFVRVGYTVSYDASSSDSKVITIQHTEANEGMRAGSTAKVVIEVYPSRTDLFTDPKIKQVYIESDGVKIPLKLNLNGEQGLDEINKIAWLFVKNIEKTDTTLPEPTSPLNRARKSLSQKRDEVYAEYNAFLANRANDWNDPNIIHRKSALEAELAGLNFRLANPDTDAAEFNKKAKVAETPLVSTQRKLRKTEQQLQQAKDRIFLKDQQIATLGAEAAAKQIQVEQALQAAIALKDVEALKVTKLEHELADAKARAETEQKARETAEQQTKVVQEELAKVKTDKMKRVAELAEKLVLDIDKEIDPIESIKELQRIQSLPGFDIKDPLNSDDVREISKILINAKQEKRNTLKQEEYSKIRALFYRLELRASV